MSIGTLQSHQVGKGHPKKLNFIQSGRLKAHLKDKVIQSNLYKETNGLELIQYTILGYFVLEETVNRRLGDGLWR